MDSTDSTDREQPLAARMRPRTLDQFVGQEHIIGRGRLLRRAIEADMITSVIFYGPPGTGKTTLARIIAHTTRKEFASLNAVLGGVKEVRQAIAKAQESYAEHRRGTILFVDEVHRWNKAQQDALLPWVESGVVSFIGATTHNPFFEINNALLSRSRIFSLTSLNKEELLRIVDQALNDDTRGYGEYAIRLEPEAVDHIIKICNGDARSLLNALQLAVENGPAPFPPKTKKNEIVVDLSTAEESIQKKAVLYDRDGDYHYDHISAFIKSVRGSDPDAALYWLAKMVYGGEDPRYIFRRLLILASEDIGLADPQALVVTEAAASAFEMIGLPEGQFHLSQATLYCALAEKSNSTLAYFDALKTVEQEETSNPPSHLQDASRDKKAFGHGEGYRYPHAYVDHWVAQQYLPATLRGRLFYTPRGVGFEGKQQERLMRRRALQLHAGDGAATNEGDGLDTGTRAVSHTPTAVRWLERISEERLSTLDAVCGTIFNSNRLARSDRVAIVGFGLQPYLWAGMRCVVANGISAYCLRDSERQEIAYHIGQLPEHSRPQVHSVGDGTPLWRGGGGAKAKSGAGAKSGASYRLVASIQYARTFLHGDVPYLEQWREWLRLLAARVDDHGYVALVERLPGGNLPLPHVLRELGEERRIVDMVERIVDHIRSHRPEYRFDEQALDSLLDADGWRLHHGERYEFAESRAINADIIQRWVPPASRDGAHSPDMRKRGVFAAATVELFSESERNDLYHALVRRLCATNIIQWPIRYTVRVVRPA